MTRRLVERIESGVDPSEVYATTYQMRNFFHQFADGFFSSLDVMNYIQHHAAVELMRRDDRVLDVCCGRGLLLPLIRYYAKEIREYVGVDISKRNISEQLRRSGVKKIDDIESYYPFTITHLIESCEDMDQHFDHGSFDFIVYTSAIEHMQKEVGARSLVNCYNLLAPDGMMFLSSPNTMDKRDPYDTQYAAHLYEWDLQELSLELAKTGFKIYDVFGLVGKVRDFEKFVEESLPKEEQEIYYRLKSYLPSKWLMSLFPILYPEAAAEVLILAGKSDKGDRRKFKKSGKKVAKKKPDQFHKLF